MCEHLARTQAHPEVYTLTATVTDQHGLADTAPVTIQLVDANDWPTIAEIQCVRTVSACAFS